MSELPRNIQLEEDLKRLKKMKPWASPRYSFSDVGNGYLFADFFKHRAHYVADRGCWYVYTGKCWECDRGAMLVMSLCKQLTHLLCQLAPTIEAEDVRERFASHVMRWRTRRTRETLLKEAAEVYPLRMDVFDRNPMLLNCLNGTLDMQEMILRPHAAGDFITRMANVSYDPHADTKPWEDFIAAVCETDNVLHPCDMSADPETGEIDAAAFAEALEATTGKQAFLQESLGYALTGRTHHECMYILYGPSTRNGKSTLLETFSALMGTYAAVAMPETLAQQAFASSRGPSEDVARLAGTRFVTLSEPDRGMRLSAALIKQLTGNDTVTCRYLHENSFQFRPQFKLFLNTNHLPAVGDDTLFRSGRLKVLEFTRHFSSTERDASLKTRLQDPLILSGALLWALQGLQRMLDKGYTVPACVLQAGEEYRLDADAVGQFIADCLVPCADARMKTADVYRAYRAWCEENGFPCENSAVFRHELARHGTVKRGRVDRSNPTNILIGYSFA
ncbi:MAG: hypothetical protein IJE07_07905 [Clostridia bacterium]|nr:hypothetical protein [Clostridia bacterium]